MALATNYAVASFVLELEGRFAGHLAAAEIGALKAAAAATPPPGEPITKRAIGNPEFGNCTIVTGLSEGQGHLDWISSLWRQSVVERNGAIILADMNFKERRRVNFSGACVTELKLDDLDATNGKKPYQMTYSFAPQMLKYESGTGAQIAGNLGMKQKSWSPANFRIRIGGLPCDRVTKVSGLSITSELTRESTGAFRLPPFRRSSVKYGDFAVEISGDDKTFAEWNKFATMTLQDGAVSENEELTCAIEWLDPTLKTIVGTLRLDGCALREFRFSPKLEHAQSGMETCTAVFAVRQFGPDGIVIRSQ